MKIRSHSSLEVYKKAFASSMDIFWETKKFPKEELFSLTDQIRRSSRSVSANIAEAFRKRRYPKHFASKLSDAEGEAAETQVWIQYAFECQYISKDIHDKLTQEYDHILGKLVNMSLNPEKWSY